ncbi:amino acid ABC transporter permease [Sporolactobacillus laevolacticus]|uniref:amino acid ABC transporter permease n=1 Tax=Sporolactobacillus laevolacticus TaxID=33018 RepID=UPI0025B322D7|nr:amino acid ABC transporter permease [Sporolactobacillus laevolacticus]MDN3954818.1 amino acid ABC transporter permease [Sporolactobacillus laevolacticus]
MDFLIIKQGIPLLLHGALISLEISLLAILFGTILGFLLTLMRLSHSNVLKGVSVTYVWAIRGLPVLILLFLIYYTTPFGIRLSSFVAGVLGLTINAAAFKAEIIRSGMLAVPKGQIEAAEAIGMNPLRVMFHVRIPQAVRIIIPPYISNCIAILKESAMVSVITVPDLMMNAQSLYSSTYKPLETLGVAAVLYLVMTSVIMLIQIFAEKKLQIK